MGRLNYTDAVALNAPTAAQFDSSTKAANTAFLARQGLQASGIAIVSATGALTSSVAGGTVIGNSASATTQTLPAANSVPAGVRIEFLNINAGTMSVARNGADTVTVNNTTVTSLALNNGDSLTLESNGSNGWYAVGGSGQLAYAALFGASLATTGWQKLPSGVIIQWGVATTTAANTPVTFTYPLAFPTAQVGVFASLLNTSGASYTASAVLTPSKTAAQVQCTYPGTASVNVLALGY